MKVDYLNLPKHFNDSRLVEAIADLFKTCEFVLGPQVEKFEESFARLCGTRFAVGVNSGADALFLALKVLGIGEGDEVISVANSFVATAGAIVATGAKPVFVDVSPDYNINPDLIEAAITQRTKAVLPVHLTGNPADMNRIMEIAKTHCLHVVEDAAQAVGASIDGKLVGSFGDLGCFSLHPLKNLNVAGDGGVITTDSDDLCERLKKLRNHGLKNRDEIQFFGYNTRLDSIQAIVANRSLSLLEGITQRRISNAKLYDKLLSGLEGNIVIPPRRPKVKQVFHTYVVQVEDRDGLMDYLAKNGVETKIHYPVPIHLQKPCRVMGYQVGDLPETEKQVRRILTLPIHQHLTTEQIHYVSDTLKEFYKSR